MFVESNESLTNRVVPPGEKRGGTRSLDTLVAEKMGKGLQMWRRTFRVLEKGTNRKVSPGMQLQTDAYLFNEGDNQLRCSVLAFSVPPSVAPDPANFGAAWGELERM